MYVQFLHHEIKEEAQNLPEATGDPKVTTIVKPFLWLNILKEPNKHPNLAKIHSRGRIKGRTNH